MKISKTTLNYATKRGINIDVIRDYDVLSDLISISWIDVNDDMGDGSEIAGYHFNPKLDDESASYLYCDDEISEEVPGYLRDEKHLRELIDFIAINRWVDC